jgi:hypothetical protein
VKAFFAPGVGGARRQEAQKSQSDLAATFPSEMVDRPTNRARREYCESTRHPLAYAAGGGHHCVQRGPYYQHTGDDDRTADDEGVDRGQGQLASLYARRYHCRKLGRREGWSDQAAEDSWCRENEVEAAVDASRSEVQKGVPKATNDEP